MSNISAEQLKACMPSAKASNIEKFLNPLNLAMDKYKIDTVQRQAAFLAQVAHESGSLRYVREIASGEAYEGRTDLGNTEPGDGVRFAGRGLIQCTGRSNYEALSVALNYDFVAEPEKLELPGAAALSAGWFWNMKNLNKWADQDDFLKISKLINGVNRKTGFPNGWEDRQRHWENCKRALGVA